MATIKIKKSKKKEVSQDKKLRDQIITSKTTSFISLSNEELINKSKELIIDICNDTSNEDNLINYEALINAMEKKILNKNILIIININTIQIIVIQILMKKYTKK